MNTGMRHTFGRSKQSFEYNHVLYGLGGLNINKNTIASWLNVTASDIINLFELDNDVYFLINTNYSLGSDIFRLSPYNVITRYDDLEGFCTGVGLRTFQTGNIQRIDIPNANNFNQRAFRFARNLQTLSIDWLNYSRINVGMFEDIASFVNKINMPNSPNVTRIDNQGMSYSNFEVGSSLQNVTTLTGISGIFSFCETQFLELPSITTNEIPRGCFEGMSNIEMIDIRNATNLYIQNVADNVNTEVFQNIKLGCTIKANIALQDFDGNGNMHPALDYAVTQRNAIISWI